MASAALPLLLLLLPWAALGRTRLHKCSLHFHPASFSALPLSWAPLSAHSNCSLQLDLPANASLLLAAFSPEAAPCPPVRSWRCPARCRGILMAPQASDEAPLWVPAARRPLRFFGSQLRLRSCPDAFGHAEVSVRAEREAGLYGLKPVLITFGLGLVCLPAWVLLLVVMRRLRRMGCGSAESGEPREEAVRRRTDPDTEVEDAPPPYDEVAKVPGSSIERSSLPTYAEAVLFLQLKRAEPRGSPPPPPPLSNSSPTFRSVLCRQQHLLQRQHDLLRARSHQPAAAVAQREGAAVIVSPASLPEHHQQLLQKQERMLREQRLLLQRLEEHEESRRRPRELQMKSASQPVPRDVTNLAAPPQMCLGQPNAPPFQEFDA